MRQWQTKQLEFFFQGKLALYASITGHFNNETTEMNFRAPYTLARNYFYFTQLVAILQSWDARQLFGTLITVGQALKIYLLCYLATKYS